MSTLITIGSDRGTTAPGSRHPLEPLSADEVRAAVALLKRDGKVTPTTRFVSVALLEPDKAFVHAPGAGLLYRASLTEMVVPHGDPGNPSAKSSTMDLHDRELHPLAWPMSRRRSTILVPGLRSRYGERGERPAMA